MNKYVIVEFQGQGYELLFNLYAMEQIEDEWGSMRAMAQELDSGKQYQSLRKLFRILGNAARESRDLPESLTGKEIRRASPDEITRIRDGILEAISLGKRTETQEGEEASDEHRDLYQDENDEKNA